LIIVRTLPDSAKSSRAGAAPKRHTAVLDERLEDAVAVRANSSPIRGDLLSAGVDATVANSEDKEKRKNGKTTSCKSGILRVIDCPPR